MKIFNLTLKKIITYFKHLIKIFAYDQQCICITRNIISKRVKQLYSTREEKYVFTEIIY